MLSTYVGFLSFLGERYYGNLSYPQDVLDTSKGHCILIPDANCSS